MGFDLLVDSTTGGTLTRRTAVWEGESYSMSAFVHERSYDELFLAIDQFKLVEADEGLTLRAKDSKKTPPDLSRPPNILKKIPGLGICQVKEFNSETSKSVPKWEGETVKGGELFMERSADGNPHFLLVGKSALTSIVTDESVDGQQAYDAVSELKVTWDRG